MNKRDEWIGKQIHDVEQREDPYVVIVTRPCSLCSSISNSGSVSLYPSAEETEMSIQQTLSVLTLFRNPSVP